MSNKRQTAGKLQVYVVLYVDITNIVTKTINGVRKKTVNPWPVIDLITPSYRQALIRKDRLVSKGKTTGNQCHVLCKKVDSTYVDYKPTLDSNQKTATGICTFKVAAICHKYTLEDYQS